MAPIMYEWGEVKTVPGNKIAITIYSWTVCTQCNMVGVACFFAKIAGIICQKSIFFEVQVTDILNMYHLCILPWSLGFRTIYIIINYAFCLNARLSLKCILDLKWKSVNQNSIKQALLYEKYFVFVLTEGTVSWV